MSSNENIQLADSTQLLERTNKLQLTWTSILLSLGVNLFLILFSFLSENILIYPLLISLGAFTVAAVLHLTKYYLASRIQFYLTLLAEILFFMSAFVSTENSMMWGFYFLLTLFLTGPFVLFTYEESDYRNGLLAIGILLMLVMPFVAKYIEIDAFLGINNAVSIQIAAQLMALLYQSVWLLSYFKISVQLVEGRERITKTIDQLNLEIESKQSQFTSMVSDVERTNLEDQKRTYVTDGLAKAIPYFRNRNNSHQLQDILLFFLQYSNASQGAIYLTVAGQNLELKAEVGLTEEQRKRKVRSTEEESFLSSCFHERQLIYRTEQTENAAVIESGLFVAKPAALAWVPLLNNNVILGVLEIHFIKTPAPEAIQFLEKVSENLAATITSIQATSYAENLLKESSLKMEQLSAQEEEMRQNMEEMAATQEELQRKEQDYIQRIAELQSLEKNR